MKKVLQLCLVILTLLIVTGCAEEKLDYPYDLRHYEKEGFSISMVKILKNPEINETLTADEQYIISSNFDAFKEAFTIQWTYNQYHYEATQEFYDNHTFDYLVAVYYGHDTPGVVLRIYSGYIIRFGQPFFQLDENKLGKLLVYLDSLIYEPFVEPAW